MATRDFDVVLWGATGYTGRLVADRLAAVETLRWAIAGRDRAKLERVRSELAAAQPRLAELPILVGDAGDAASLDAIVKRTKVVCTTVGPYAIHGSGMVAACVRAGTHYCDLTGEVPWIRKMIDEHDAGARKSGARIVHCCGFDSIPSDLGVWMLHQEMKARGAHLAKVDAYFGESSGRFSGGTIHSLLGVIDEARRDKEVRRVLGDPYALDPSPRQGGPDGGDARGVHWEPRLRMWTAPFVMAAINTRIVRRSNAIAGYPYGAGFRYSEQMSLPGTARGLATATAISGGIAGFVVATQVPPLRRLIEQKLPSPGEGPTAEQRERGHFCVRLIAESDGATPLRLFGRVADRRDPGYGSTSVMLSESALSLALDPITHPGGVITPAIAMGDALLSRLRAAGMTFDVEDHAS
jgi:short subunit dehydrogenase-like uncharacterized protein